MNLTQFKIIYNLPEKAEVFNYSLGNSCGCLDVLQEFKIRYLSVCVVIL